MFRTKRRKVERLDFILAGAQKSGTTALHYFLSRHPNIAMGDQQEIHFFDNDAMFVAEPDYEQLHKHYPLLAPSTIAGDCTPSYLYHEPASNGFGITIRKSSCSFCCEIRSSAPLPIGTCNVSKASSHWIFSMRLEKKKRASPARRRSSTPFCLRRAGILCPTTRACFQIFSARANEGREI